MRRWITKVMMMEGNLKRRGGREGEEGGGERERGGGMKEVEVKGGVTGDLARFQTCQLGD